MMDVLKLLFLKANCLFRQINFFFFFIKNLLRWAVLQLYYASFCLEDYKNQKISRR